MRRDSGRTLEHNDRLWITLVLIVFGIAVLRLSWLNDDAYITFRVIENFVNGYGPVYNIGERVQVFTHPLWMLLLSTFYFLFEIIGIHVPGALPLIALTVSWMAIGVAISASLIQSREKPLIFLLGIWLMLTSKGFSDYVASGLENPLTFAFLAIFTLFFWRLVTADGSLPSEDILPLSLLAGLATLNRMDVLLLFAPALIFAWWISTDRFKAGLLVALGFLPFIIWELFSLIYFGFFFPNTAYAKLNSAIPAAEYIQQGVLYLVNSISLDPVSLIAVSTVILIGFRQRERRLTPVISGIFLYLLYIVRIGGDYMSGRFIGTLVFASALCLPRLELDWKQIAVPTFLTLLLAGIASGSMPYLSDSTFSHVYFDNKGISDERGFRYPEWGFLRITRNRLLPDAPAAWDDLEQDAPIDVRISGAIGLQGYLGGPRVHVLDVMALADPLLARLPARFQEHWRVGHIEREIPEGYIETLKSGQNVIQDPSLRRYYSHLRTIIQGPITAKGRMQTIIDFNLGKFDPYLEAYLAGS